jgi:hypothetical protein
VARRSQADRDAEAVASLVSLVLSVLQVLVALAGFTVFLVVITVGHGIKFAFGSLRDSVRALLGAATSEPHPSRAADGLVGRVLTFVVALMLLTAALHGQLWLPDLGEGWVFLAQEWRFLNPYGTGKKSDVLALHLPTGRAGIVEFKSSEDALDEARDQVHEYGQYWQRDAATLAPFFTKLIQAMGTAYGNHDAASGRVSTEPPRLFVGVASPERGVRIWAC